MNVSISNAAFSFDNMTTSIVAVVTDVVKGGKPVVGYAFNSTGRYACGAQMRNRMIPRLLRQKPDDLMDPVTGVFSPEAAVRAMMFGEKPGGDMERAVAIGTIETALWDALAKTLDMPLHRLLSERYGNGVTPEKMFCYVGGGWYKADETPASLRAEMQGYLDTGYTLIKTKIGGLPIDEDRARIENILGILDSPSQLAVDANCGLSPERALQYAEAFGDLGLAWFEEPVNPVDYAATSDFVKAYIHPVATGENLFSQAELRNLLRYGGFRPGIDIVQIDVPQSYGMAACAANMKMLEDYGWSASSVLPHGGNQMSLAAALGFGMGMCESYPSVFGVFSGYADDAKVVDGYLPAPDRPGIGFEAQAELFSLFSTLTD
ncbi:enolase C-terminal domain-like protein [Hoeflea sp. IMCC20628]|uniref:enolase C-terminal domain-like protein n=1 Tax=Hoeflea sp. IMCC20628 TaxID=1620421 RepID=UPI00069C9FE0|nr:enolase C-terminal domain-like protein [Hoeflea sp. IMCC20628]